MSISIGTEVGRHLSAIPTRTVGVVNNNVEKILTEDNLKVISSERQSSESVNSRSLYEKEILILKLFDEFTKKDEGKVLASELRKFAKYVQSEVSKPIL